MAGLQNVSSSARRGRRAEVMHALSFSHNAADWLRAGDVLRAAEGGGGGGEKRALFPLISTIVPYLKHDIEPDCQSKPKQILLEELQKEKKYIGEGGGGGGGGVWAQLRWVASDMADANVVSVNCWEPGELAQAATLLQHLADIWTFITVSNVSC